MKACRICETEKTPYNFRKDGKICRKCANIRNKVNNDKYKEKNKAKRKEWSKEHYLKTKDSKEFKEAKKISQKKGREILSRTYVYTTLYSRGFKPNEITDELIETQRIILKTKRLCKTLKN